MDNSIKKVVLSIGFLFFFILGNAQNAHMNLGNLLESLPAVKAANTQLEGLQKSLATQGDQMVKAYKAKKKIADDKYNRGELSQIQATDETGKLKIEENKILAFEQKAGFDIQNKRKELMQPILVKIDQAIQTVAKEGGYKMIFDTSVFNALLYAQDSDDVTELVKGKL